jgi:hypothetical protein
MTVLIPRHCGQSATVRDGVTGKKLATTDDTSWSLGGDHVNTSGSSTKVL